MLGLEADGGGLTRQMQPWRAIETFFGDAVKYRRLKNNSPPFRTTLGEARLAGKKPAPHGCMEPADGLGSLSESGFGSRESEVSAAWAALPRLSG